MLQFWMILRFWITDLKQYTILKKLNRNKKSENGITSGQLNTRWLSQNENVKFCHTLVLKVCSATEPWSSMLQLVSQSHCHRCSCYGMITVKSQVNYIDVTLARLR